MIRNGVRDYSNLLARNNCHTKTQYGPKRHTNGWRMRTNKELQDQYRSADIVTAVNVRRLEWAGHVVRMEGESMVKRVFLGNRGGRRKPGRPKLRWFGCVTDGVKTLGVRRWR
jgi:hypothetical protein